MTPAQGTNTEDMVRLALDFNDREVGTKRVDTITQLLGNDGSPLKSKLTELLNMLNVRRADEPIKLKAKCMYSVFSSLMLDKFRYLFIFSCCFFAMCSTSIAEAVVQE